MTMTPERLAEIEARANAATMRPWDCNKSFGNYPDGKFVIESSPADFRLICEMGHSHPTQSSGEQSHRDGVFIAASRTDVPDLVAEVRRLRRLVHAVIEYDDALRDLRFAEGYYGNGAHEAKPASARLGEAIVKYQAALDVVKHDRQEMNS